MGNYDDIIGLERPISKKHAPMPLPNRAAQFMPFAALTGYDDAVEETARLTEDRIELTEEMRQELDEKLSEIEVRLHSIPAAENDTTDASAHIEKTADRAQVLAAVTYFIPDELKSGGEYVTRQVMIRRIDSYERCLVLADKTKIYIDEIMAIEL